MTGKSHLLAQAAEQLHPVHPRHLDVEHGEVGRVLDERLQRRLAVRIEAGDEALGLERHRQRGQDVAVVVDQRDVIDIPAAAFSQGRLAPRSPFDARRGARHWR